MIELELPEALQERTRRIRSGKLEGEFVVYWIRNAIRVDENPALDVAVVAANQLNLPLLVFQGLSPDYRFASDRHHTFILQGARDVQQRFDEMGISYVFHLENSNDDRPRLLEFAERSALLVTEDMPVNPAVRFLNVVLERTNKPVWCVDTACVVPMQLVGKAYTRAFQYRNKTKKLYQKRVSRNWDKQDFGSVSKFDSPLPFHGLDLQNTNLADLVASCDIDHAVGAIMDTKGGSTEGYLRWDEFKKTGLAKYDKKRNNALVDGVSRMSAYLHYGMVSPFRLARESADLDCAGAEKYLDELLIWRELAYSFCFYNPQHFQWDAIPDWAKETLLEHVNDQRDSIYDWEDLSRGETEDCFWNAAQASLLRQGELHNNVRMTWGKTILQWLACPKEALKMIIDLNHRYALDGRDPASYGGILWCLGQFDRPFQPPTKVMGTVRPRPTHVHAKRLDVEAYALKTGRVRFEPLSVAVVGAGLSGLIAARVLQDHGVEVAVFDKGRGVGGRMSTRRVGEILTFDHGAQYFTVRDERFRRYVEAWQAKGVVATWPNNENESIVVIKEGEVVSESRSQQRFVGVPGMNSIAKHLAQDLKVETKTRISCVATVDDKLQVKSEQRDWGLFDRVILSAPPHQAAEILPERSTLPHQLRQVDLTPCWAVMVAFESRLNLNWQGAFVHDSFISWIGRNGTKPSRLSSLDSFVIHANSEWTAVNWERDPNDVASLVLDEFWNVVQLDKSEASHLNSHRWKYAISQSTDLINAERCLFDQELGIVACGDWASGSRVEGAFLSGLSAAGRILGTRRPQMKQQTLLD